MSPRPKSDDSRDAQYRLRMSEAEVKKLEFCCNTLNMTKAEVIRNGIEKMYQEAVKRSIKDD